MMRASVFLILLSLILVHGGTNSTSSPSSFPSSAPTTQPSGAPSSGPSNYPSDVPTLSPSGTPSGVPTLSPSGTPFSAPTTSPSGTPSGAPTGIPTKDISSYQGLELDIACLEAFCLSVDCLNYNTTFASWDFTMNTANTAYEHNPCTENWFGIECKTFSYTFGVTSKRIVSIYITHKNLMGTLSPQLAYMNELEELDLSHNKLTGIIPYQYNNFSDNLVSINIAHNELQGAVRQCGLLTGSSTGITPKFTFLDVTNSGITCYDECWDAFIDTKLYTGPNTPECTQEPSSRPTSSPTRATPKPSFAPSSLPSGMPSSFPSSIPTYLPTQYERIDMRGLEAFCTAVDCQTNSRFQEKKILGNLVYSYWNFTKIYDNNGIFIEYAHNACTENWYGIECKDINVGGKIERRVTSLTTRTAGLSGYLPELMSQLQYLRYLDVSINQLTGTIPDSFNTFHYITELILSDNKFSGSLQLCELERENILFSLDATNSGLSCYDSCWYNSATNTTKSDVSVGNMPQCVITNSPTVAPTSQVTTSTSAPFARSSTFPTGTPTGQPSAIPTTQPTSMPSTPSSVPTGIPTGQTSVITTVQPTSMPSIPSSVPTTAPSSSVPTPNPSHEPYVPTPSPTTSPTVYPTVNPTLQPTPHPSHEPHVPTPSPVNPTGNPTKEPSAHTTTAQPTSLQTELTMSPTSEVGGSSGSKVRDEDSGSIHTIIGITISIVVIGIIGCSMFYKEGIHSRLNKLKRFVDDSNNTNEEFDVDAVGNSTHHGSSSQHGGEATMNPITLNTKNTKSTAQDLAFVDSTNDIIPAEEKPERTSFMDRIFGRSESKSSSSNNNTTNEKEKIESRRRSKSKNFIKNPMQERRGSGYGGKVSTKSENSEASNTAPAAPGTRAQPASAVSAPSVSNTNEGERGSIHDNTEGIHVRRASTIRRSEVHIMKEETSASTNTSTIEEEDTDNKNSESAPTSAPPAVPTTEPPSEEVSHTLTSVHNKPTFTANHVGRRASSVSPTTIDVSPKASGATSRRRTLITIGSKGATAVDGSGEESHSSKISRLPNTVSGNSSSNKKNGNTDGDDVPEPFDFL